MINTNKKTTVIMSSDNNYACYLGVCISSIISNSSKDSLYEIFILDGGIAQSTKTKILDYNNSNFDIQFIDVHHLIKQYDGDIFKLNRYFSIATYYRFFLPILFPNHKKVVYLDCDTIVNRDLSVLMDIDLESYFFAATRDLYVSSVSKKDNEFADYLKNTLKLHDHANYFQAGLMIWNLEYLRDLNFTNKLIDALIEVKKPVFLDQCILNSLSENKVKFLDQKWNFTWHISFEDFLSNHDELRDVVHDLAKEPFIIHFTSGSKPWRNPEIYLSSYFWKYARETPFYEEIIFKNTAISAKKSISCIKILRYKLLSKVSIGSRREKYLKKIKALQEKS